MKLGKLIGVEMEEQEIMAEIKKAVEHGFHEVKLGEVLLKLPHREVGLPAWDSPWEGG